ncbi:MAG: DUF4238 domain-containing protein [Halanaerobiales bacterium]
MSSRKKQHYIPRFYLKLFSHEYNGKRIGIYNLNREKYIPSKLGKLKSQAYSDYFYGKDGSIEEVLGDLESISAPIIHDMIENHNLPKYETETHLKLITFIAIMSARTEYSADVITEVVDKTTKSIFREHPDVKNTEYEKYIDELKFESDSPAAFSLSVMAGSSPIISDLHFKIIENESNYDFITSDNPIVKYNRFLEEKETFGNDTALAVRGLQIFFPLNHTHYLMLYDPFVYKVGNKKDIVIKINNRKDVDELNLLQLINAYRNIYFNHNINENYCSELLRKGKRFMRGKKVNVEEFQAGFKNKFIEAYNEDINMKLKLSFVSIKRKASKYQFIKDIDYIREPELVAEVVRINRMINEIQRNKR